MEVKLCSVITFYAGNKQQQDKTLTPRNNILFQAKSRTKNENQMLIRTTSIIGIFLIYWIIISNDLGVRPQKIK